ncbi:MAG: glycosyltransferase [Gammaproteobacteria bacterium]
MGKHLSRILVLTSTYPRWKNDTLPPFVHELCRQLTDNFEIHVLAPHARDTDIKEVMDGVHIHRFRYLPSKWETVAYKHGLLGNLRKNPLELFKLPIFFFLQALATAKLVRALRPKVLHAHWIIPQGISAILGTRLARISVPILLTSHGGDVFTLDNGPGNDVKRWVLRRCTAITGVSHAVVEKINEIASPTCSVLVRPMGVDLRNRFCPVSVVRNEQQLLYVGRLAEKKGVRYLISAVAELSQDFPNLILKIVGDGPERAYLESQAAKLNVADQIQFLGSKPNQALPGFYQHATLTIFPSITAKSGDQEGLGLVPVEAIGCGCPVIASNLPAIRDVITDGSNGLLVPPKDVPTLAHAIAKLLSDSQFRTKLANQARSDAIAKFDWQPVTENYKKLLYEVASKS